MRSIIVVSLSCIVAAATAGSLGACSGNNSNSGFGPGSDGGSGSGGGSSSGGSSGGSSSGGSSGGSGSGSGGLVGDGGSSSGGNDGSVTTMITVYAHTDDTLYKVDPMTQAVTMVGMFTGTSDASTDSTVTDLAVDGNGDVYVNTESVVYKANVPASPGPVALTKVTTIMSSNRFVALAFAPKGALDPNAETLVGGDTGGLLWAINTTTGATIQLGNFGADTANGGTFELSGDIVFYLDSMNNPTGLATIRSCTTSGTKTTCGTDYLAGVDMTKLKAAFNGTAQTSLLAGIYGGTTANPVGAGIGFHDVFGLGAWNSTIFGFTRNYTSVMQTPQIITIDPMTGAGTALPPVFTFTNGWSGAGVTTKVTIMAPPPPPPPAQ